MPFLAAESARHWATRQAARRRFRPRSAERSRRESPWQDRPPGRVRHHLRLPSESSVWYQDTPRHLSMILYAGFQLVGALLEGNGAVDRARTRPSRYLEPVSTSGFTQAGGCWPASTASTFRAASSDMRWRVRIGVLVDSRKPTGLSPRRGQAAAPRRAGCQVGISRTWPTAPRMISSSWR